MPIFQNNPHLVFTGERMMNHPRSDTYRMHMDRYVFATRYIKHSSVLDISCGSGYGAFEMARYASSVTGVDIDNDTIEYCARTYKKDNLSFFTTPAETCDERLIGVFDTIVSFETVEHTKDGVRFIKHLLQYMRPGGTLILSTPNNFMRHHPSKNPFHVYEYEIRELYAILQRLATRANIEVFGQYKSNARKNDPLTANSTATFIGPIIKAAYLFDTYHLGILKYIEHTAIYKAIGAMQYRQQKDFAIYPINLSENFIHPMVSLYVVHT